MPQSGSWQPKRSRCYCKRLFTETRATGSPAVGGCSAPRAGLSPTSPTDFGPTMTMDTRSRKATDSSIDDDHRRGREVAT